MSFTELGGWALNRTDHQNEWCVMSLRVMVMPYLVKIVVTAFFLSAAGIHVRNPLPHISTHTPLHLHTVNGTPKNLQCVYSLPTRELIGAMKSWPKAGTFEFPADKGAHML